MKRQAIKAMVGFSILWAVIFIAVYITFIRPEVRHRGMLEILNKIEQRERDRLMDQRKDYPFYYRFYDYPMTSNEVHNHCLWLTDPIKKDGGVE